MHRLTIDFAGKISAMGGFDDADGVRVVKWTLDAIDDATAGYAHKVTVVNTISSL
jgi:hypothetical protein